MRFHLHCLQHDEQIVQLHLCTVLDSDVDDLPGIGA